MVRKINLFGLIAVLLSFIAGGLVRHYKLPPIPQLAEIRNQLFSKTKIQEIQRKIEIIAYEKTAELYVDRPYIETLGTAELDRTYLVKIERHRKNPIRLHIRKPVLAIRFVAAENDNSVFEGWEKTSDKIFVNGGGSQHTIVVWKRLMPGFHLLPSGGPLSSSPLLLKAVVGNITASDIDVLELTK